MTVSQELREWANARQPFTYLLSEDAYEALFVYRDTVFDIVVMPHDDRRTFALLVAEALEN